jgi:hypothetical protein
MLSHCGLLLQVPRSSKKLSEDNEYALYTVTLFRKVADTFKTSAREKGFQVGSKPLLQGKTSIYIFKSRVHDTNLTTHSLTLMKTCEIRFEILSLILKGRHNKGKN